MEAEQRAKKLGSEVASFATKGRNINTLLLDYAGGDLNAGAQWINGVACVTASKVASVRWSRGLKNKLGLDLGSLDYAASCAVETSITDDNANLK